MTASAPLPILRLAAGGDGVGRLEDGRTVFVPRTAPGDLVELASVREHRRFARARVGRLVEPGPDRVEPRCPHYTADECGGCQLQHLSQPAQLEARRGFVGDALRRLGKLDVADPAIVPADAAWEYRTKLTLAVGPGLRRIGLHPLDRPNQVFDLRWCHITAAALNEVWQAASRARRLLPPNTQQLVLRLDREGGRHLIVRVGPGPVWAGGKELARRLEQSGAAATVWWQPEGGAARVVSGDDEAFPASVFEQVHPAMGDRVRAHAVELLGALEGLHVWDLYAGIGETTAQLAAAGATVESVESDRRAVLHAEEHGAVGRPRVVRLAGRVEDALRDLHAPAAVVTNPPRIGMDERVTAALRQAAPARIVYISCDPATLARDLTRLGAEWRVASVRAFDLFPQTAHVETVVLLERQ